ncbi:hypothetical protein D3Z38_16025 [Clostridiales bacterium]|nr:hypothetical protein [Clostridiales bacterium]
MSPERPYTRSYCFICTNGNSSEIIEGLADAQHFDSDIMWKRGDNENIICKYILTKTDEETQKSWMCIRLGFS